MSAATQNEMERLREERDALQQQLNAALEREAALAALMEEAIEGFERIGNFDSEYDLIAPDMQKRLNDLNSILTRRDLLQRAEELEYFLTIEYGGNLDFGAVFKIEKRAADLRRQAQELQP